MTKRINRHDRRRAKRVYVRFEYKRFLAYLAVRYIPNQTTGDLIAESIYGAANRQGFMRRFLCAPPPETETERIDRLEREAHRQRLVGRLKARKAAYYAEYRPYDPNETYIVPEVWKTWDEENPDPDAVEPTASRNRTLDKLLRAAFNPPIAS